MLNLTLTQLNYIVALDKYRNFVTAAKASFVTQPTLSIQIQKLEEQLQIKIFDREKSPVIPTEMGKKIIEQAKITLREANRLQEMVSETKETLQGEFKLGVIPSVSSALLPLFLHQFITRYPQVKLKISEYQTEQLLELLVNDEIDAGIAATPLNRSGIEEIFLYNEPFVVYTPPEHPFQNKKKILSSEVVKESLKGNILLLEEGHCFRDQVLQICQIEKSLEHNSLTFESGQFWSLISLVDRGVGFTLLPLLVAKMLPQEKEASQCRPISGDIPLREISLVIRRNVVKEKITKALIHLIEENLPQELTKIKSGHGHIVVP